MKLIPLSVIFINQKPIGLTTLQITRRWVGCWICGVVAFLYVLSKYKYVCLWAGKLIFV